MTQSRSVKKSVTKSGNEYPPCEHCTNPVPLTRLTCPHCGQPSLFPNVRASNAPDQVAKLTERFDLAIKDAEKRGCEAQVGAFADKCKRSQAMMGYSLEKLNRASNAGTEIFEGYHQRENLRARSEIPSEPDWQTLRIQVEAAILGGRRPDPEEPLHYAVLTIDPTATNSYGECTIVLKESMIAHRTSCFEENSGVFWMNTKTFPPGKRSDWATRYKLCVAKLFKCITVSTENTDFPSILLGPGTGKLDENFVEAQIFGPLTLRTVESVSVLIGKLEGPKSYWKAIKKKLVLSGVKVSEK